MEIPEFDPRTPITEKEAHRILARAAKLEGDAGSITLDELQRAAIEAGIGQAAFLEATQVVLTARHGAAGSPIVRPTWARVVFAAAGGGLLGGVARVLTEFIEPNSLIDVPFSIILIAASLNVAHRASPSGDLSTGTLARIGGMWIGVMTGWAAVAQSITVDLIFGLGGIGVATCAVAAAMMARADSQGNITRDPQDNRSL